MCELCASVLTWFCIITVCLRSPPYAGSPPLYTFLATKMIDYSVVSLCVRQCLVIMYTCVPRDGNDHRFVMCVQLIQKHV